MRISPLCIHGDFPILISLRRQSINWQITPECPLCLSVNIAVFNLGKPLSFWIEYWCFTPNRGIVSITIPVLWETRSSLSNCMSADSQYRNTGARLTGELCTHGCNPKCHWYPKLDGKVDCDRIIRIADNNQYMKRYLHMSLLEQNMRKNISDFDIMICFIHFSNSLPISTQPLYTCLSPPIT